MAAELSAVLAELFLAVCALAGLLVAAFSQQDGVARPLVWTAAGVMLAVALLILIGDGGQRVIFDGMYLQDSFGRFAKVTVLICAAAVLAMSEGYMRTRGLLRFEFPVLVMLCVVGMMVMVSAGDLLVLYMGLELQALALYVIATLRKESPRTTAAAMTLFGFGALSSLVLLYGASLVYGFAGTTRFEGILVAVEAGEGGIGLTIGLFLLIAGLAFKLSAVPFHVWTADVYEGASTPATVFLATAPLIATVALLARLLHDGFGAGAGDWQQIVALLAALSMIVGSLATVGQRNIKRLMGYATVAHVGFALMGLAAGTVLGVQAMLIYLTIYAAMSLGVFAFILMMERDGAPVTDIDALRMYAAQAPGRALAMLALLFSMAGVPPLLGFFGKLYVLRAAFEGGFGWLVLVGVLVSVIGAYAYLRMVYFMYFGGEPDEALDAPRGTVLPAFVVATALIAVLGIVNMFGIEDAAAAAASALVN